MSGPTAAQGPLGFLPALWACDRALWNVASAWGEAHVKWQARDPVPVFPGLPGQWKEREGSSSPGPEEIFGLSLTLPLFLFIPSLGRISMPGGIIPDLTPLPTPVHVLFTVLPAGPGTSHTGVIPDKHEPG